MKTIPPAIDQGYLNNCKAWAICYGLKHHFGLDFDPNWLMAIGTQRGAGINHMLDALMQYGALPKGDYSVEPTSTEIARLWLMEREYTYQSIAAKYKIKEYKKITSVADLMAAINGEWYVAFGVAVPSVGIYPVDADGLFRPHLAPKRETTHAMSAWRVNPDGTIRVLNSWGAGWGDNGQANMTAEDILRLDHCFAYRFDEPKPEPDKKGDQFLREQKIIAGIADGNKLSVRETPESGGAVVDYVRNGESVTVLDRKDGRALITDGKCGWVQEKYLIDRPPDPAQPTTPIEQLKKGVHEFAETDKEKRLTEHYTVGDFWAYPNHKKIKLDTTLAHILEKFYAKFGVRPLLRNKNLGTDKPYLAQPSAGYRDALNWTGSKTSQHCYGRGLDFYIPGVPAYKLAQFAETLPEIGGIGLYLAKSGELDKVKHIHIDTRTNRARWGWNGQTSGTNTPGFGGIPCVFKYVKNKLQRSAAIEELQRKLNSLGYNAGAPDGVYGPKTKAAVMLFQHHRNLRADGIYGKETNKALGLFTW